MKSKEEVRKILKEIIVSLEKGGYNPYEQIVGYLNSGDPGYVSSFLQTRQKIISLYRENVIQMMLKEFLDN